MGKIAPPPSTIPSQRCHPIITQGAKGARTMNSKRCTNRGQGHVGDKEDRLMKSPLPYSRTFNSTQPQVWVSSHCVLSPDGVRYTDDFPVYDPGTAGSMYQGEKSLVCSLSGTGSLAGFPEPSESWLLPLLKTWTTVCSV